MLGTASPRPVPSFSKASGEAARSGGWGPGPCWGDPFHARSHPWEGKGCCWHLLCFSPALCPGRNRGGPACPPCSCQSCAVGEGGSRAPTEDLGREWGVEPGSLEDCSGPPDLKEVFFIYRLGRLPSWLCFGVQSSWVTLFVCSSGKEQESRSLLKINKLMAGQEIA